MLEGQTFATQLGTSTTHRQRPRPPHTQRRAGSHQRWWRRSTNKWAAAAFTLCLLLQCIGQSQARNWTLQQETSQHQFFDDFWFWPYGDPTHGTVAYQSKSAAIRQNLTYVDQSTGRFVMRADSTSFIPDTAAGRPSVRLQSQNTMSDGLLVAKISSMPTGCGTWPAFWTVTTNNWPSGGEIDIIEGVSSIDGSSSYNLASLHTTNGCTIPSGASNSSTGSTYQDDCAYQPGCSQHFQRGNSFGVNYNQNGGGYFAMLRDTQPGGNGISVYFWPASTPISQIPLAVRSAPGQAPHRVITSPYDLAPGGNNNSLNLLPDKTYQWGLPAAFFPNTPAGQTVSGGSCQMDNFFEDHSIIINLTFCGYWAGQVWSQSECVALAPTCDEYVRNNPHAFENASFEIDYIRIYSSKSSRGHGSIILGNGPGLLRPAWSMLAWAVLVGLVAGRVWM
ncbi:hypothetical protein OC861_004222 [Tilletia horrida]|nr:hypothetical protein OC861_004222 [Tilletia horrida]